MQFIQWSSQSSTLIASSDFGIIDGQMRYCIGDNPRYADEYPALSSVLEDGRVVMCMPNAPGWWRAWSYRRPQPVVFEVDDESIVYIGLCEFAITPVMAKDALAELEKMLEETNEGFRFCENFEVCVPLAVLPPNIFPRSYRERKWGKDIALITTGNLPVAAVQVVSPPMDYTFLAETLGYPEEAALLVEADRLGINFLGYRNSVDIWNIGIHNANALTVDQLFFELAAAVELVKNSGDLQVAR